MYPEIRVPVSVFYNEESKKIVLKINTEIEICESKIEEYTDYNEIQRKTEDILNDPDKTLSLVGAVNINGELEIYDSSRMQTQLYEVEIPRNFLEENKERPDLVLEVVKEKILRGLVKIESRLLIPILDT